jgi:hypothetical protein
MNELRDADCLIVKYSDTGTHSYFFYFIPNSHEIGSFGPTKSKLGAQKILKLFPIKPHNYFCNKTRRARRLPIDPRDMVRVETSPEIHHCQDWYSE